MPNKLHSLYLQELLNELLDEDYDLAARRMLDTIQRQMRSSMSDYQKSIIALQDRAEQLAIAQLPLTSSDPFLQDVKTTYGSSMSAVATLTLPVMRALETSSRVLGQTFVLASILSALGHPITRKENLNLETLKKLATDLCTLRPGHDLPQTPQRPPGPTPAKL